MTRRGLSILVGIVGTIIAALMVLLILVMGSVFADARTENIAGPGVDIFLRTPFPTEGGKVTLDIEARGGNKAGVEGIVVAERGKPIATAQGKGKTWGFTIQSSRSRGSDTESITFDVPNDLHAGDTMHLDVQVGYVVAMSSSGSFTNQSKLGNVKLDIDVYSPGGRIRAQLARLLLALATFLAWFLIVWGIAKLYARAGRDEIGRHNSEMEAIGLLMGYVGGCVLGYWLFAWRIMNAFELRSTLWAVLFVAVWCIAPLAFVWRWWKRQKRAELPTARVVTR